MANEETTPPSNESQPVRKSARSTGRKRVTSPATPPTPPAPPKRRKRMPSVSPPESSPAPREESLIPKECPPTIHGGPPLDLAGVYAPLLRLRHKRQLDSTPVVSLPPRTIGGVRDQLEKHKVCNCRRSNCLKLYCDCFQAGLHCHSSCNCVSCQNTDEYQMERNLSIDVTLLRNSNSFRPRLVGIASDPQPSFPATKNNSGCNCKKSFCLKKYCECFHLAVYCAPLQCRCIDCQNRPGNKERERLIGKRRSQDKVAAAAAALAHQHSRMSGRMAMMGEAGRAYFHHAPGEGKDVEASTAAAAVAAGAVAGGVDLFLPPSSYTVPMTLASGMPFASLAFATSDDNTKQQVTPPRNKKSIRIQPHLKWETDLQRLWRVERGRVNETFDKVQAFIDTQTPINRAKNVDAVVHSRARATVDSLQQDIKAIVTAVQKAEVKAVRYMDAMEVPHIKPTPKNPTDESLQENVTTHISDADPLHDLPTEASTKDAIPADSSNGNNEAIAAIAAPFGNQPLGKTALTADDELTGPLTKDAIPSDLSDRDITIDDSATPRAEEAPTPARLTEQPTVSDANLSGGVMDASAPMQNALDDSPLLCDETMDNSEERALSEDAVRQLTILAAQEAALLGQLAQIIRRKTLDMTRERIRLVMNAKKK